MRTPYFIFIILLLAFTSCKSKTSGLAGKEKIEAEDFFTAFTKLKLPYTISDSSKQIRTDTTLISIDVLQQFIPDSVLNRFFGKNSNKFNFYPAGKIQKADEEYLLIVSEKNQRDKLAVFVFDKKHQYLSALSLLEFSKRNSYNNWVFINTEPTFTISRDKTINNQYFYTKTGLAYNKDAKDFVAVITDTNEDTKRLSEIINPIDTLARKNKFSGDYVQNKKNYISLRDGSNENNYTFFIHFEKDGGCVGELKGTIKMIDATKGIYQENGDLCVIDFKMSKASVNVKERGNCGTHRGIKCFFNDTYQLKKPVKTARKNS